MDWYIVKGVTGHLTIAREDELKYRTEVIKDFKAKSFLEAHKYKEEYMNGCRSNDKRFTRV